MVKNRADISTKYWNLLDLDMRIPLFDEKNMYIKFTLSFNIFRLFAKYCFLHTEIDLPTMVIYFEISTYKSRW